jgi:hypothetical protein
MALVLTIKEVGTGDGSLKLATWDNLDEADTAPPAIEFQEWGDRSVQVVGTFSGGTVVIEGSNDGATYATLTDPHDTPLSFTATGLMQIVEIPMFIRPRVTLGSGVDVDVYILMRRTSGMRN